MHDNIVHLMPQLVYSFTCNQVTLCLHIRMMSTALCSMSNVLDRIMTT